ncbi:pyridoxamine 5'-phosphate oxidase [[Actinobacillus] muris]|uniref:Pyridoxine/pyridoxamine 5'-phosphate oxidase n=1 Tax=Muribacter muris TaxID=67855 RepID=A0A0J5P4E8_9PAST|nr:pyridoxamine 5'-phosphate oxidase [Muribacter muris]KMK51303.1 pyridoxamine 5'-phosphate oxidase [[Actinobacillus] muris] [Muribacter muris]
MDLHHIREEYSKRQLSKSQCAAEPLTQFRQWLNEAIQAKVNEPTAMNLATVENGRPVSRIVLLKEVNQEGFIFFTNYHSRKGQNISQAPYVALNFFWAELERQVRVEGDITPISEQASTDYFHSRPYTSQIGAWASEQSQPIENKQWLLARAAKFALKHPLSVPKPDHWGGYLVRPNYVEFWQGRPSRLHDRICYQKTAEQWQKVRLSP